MNCMPFPDYAVPIKSSLDILLVGNHVSNITHSLGFKIRSAIHPTAKCLAEPRHYSGDILAVEW